MPNEQESTTVSTTQELETLRQHKAKLEEDLFKTREKMKSYETKFQQISSAFGTEDPVAAVQAQKQQMEINAQNAQKIRVAALEALVRNPVHPELTDYALEQIARKASVGNDGAVAGITETLAEVKQSKLHQILSGVTSSPEPARPNPSAVVGNQAFEKVSSLKDLMQMGFAAVEEFKRTHPDRYNALENAALQPITRQKLKTIPFIGSPVQK